MAVPDEDEEDIELGPITRRRAMQLGAGLGAAGLAGCGGDGDSDGGGDGTTTTTTEAGTVETTEDGTTKLHSMVSWDFSAEDMTMNRWGPTPYPGGQFNVFFTPILSYSFVEDRYFQELGRDFPYMEGCTMHVPMKKDEFYWWSGEAVKAGDRVYGHQIATYMCCGGVDAVPWEARFGKDEYEYKETKVGVMNEEFRKQNMKNRGPDFKRTVWKPFWEQIQDATSEDKINQITEEVRQVDLTLPKVIEEGYGYGLWKPVDYASDFIEFEQWEKHPYHGQSDIDRWRWHVLSNEQSRFQALEQNTIDTTSIDLGGNENIQAPDDMEEAYQYPSFLAQRIGFNWRSKHLARRGVRRAINYLLDRKKLADLITGSGAIPQDHQVTAGPNDLVRELIGEDFVAQTISYGVESQPDKARAAMQDAGYSMQGGNWVGPDGDAIEGLQFISRANAQDALLANTVNGLLNDFGIGNELLTMEGTSFQTRFNDDYDFDIDLGYTQARGPAKGPFWDVHHPIEGLPDTADTSDPEVCDTPDPDNPETFAGRQPRDDVDSALPHRIPADPFPEYPGLDNVGAMEMQGNESFDPHQAALNLRLQFPDDYLLRKAREFAWWFNFNAFHVFPFTFAQSEWMDTANFQIRDDAVPRGTGPGQNPITWGDVNTR